MKTIQVWGIVVFLVAIIGSIIFDLVRLNTLMHITYPFWVLGAILAFLGPNILEMLAKAKNRKHNTANAIA